MDDATLAALRLVASAWVDVAFALAFGALASALALADGTTAWRATRERGALRWLGASTAAALAGMLALLWIEAMTMAEVGPGAAFGELRGVLAGTQWGHAWACAFASLALLLVAWLGLRRRLRDLRAAAVFACLVFALARAGASHAGARGFNGATVVMAVHLLATAAWSGLVFVAALVVLPEDGSPLAPDDRAAWLRWLSRCATIALALVAATGVAAALAEIGPTLAPLASPGWGFILDAKLALVATAVALGAWNRFVGLPPLLAAPATASPRGFARVLRVEAVVLLAVLLAAAALANGEAPPVKV